MTNTSQQSVVPTTDQGDDPVFLKRQVAELKDVLARIVHGARSTSAAANCCIVHRQVLGEARQILEEEDNDRIARFMELEALEEEDSEPPEPDGECYRGSEAASALAEEQARVHRELK